MNAQEIFTANKSGKPELARIFPKNSKFESFNIKYAVIFEKEFKDSFNLAFADNNHNGILDSNDVISLSKDDVFYTNGKQLSCNLFNSVQIIQGFQNQYKFKLLDPQTWTFSLEKLSGKAQNPDISLQHILTDFALGEQTIYEIIDTNSLVILDLFSEFCSVCIKSIPKLNKLNQSIKIIGLIETSQDLAHFIKMNNILYESFLLSPAIKQNFNLNGNPNYILIGKNKEFLRQEYSIEKLLEPAK